MSNVSHLMNAPFSRICLISLLGLSAPLWWTFTVSNLIFGIFQLAGNPTAPSASFAWASIFVPNIVLGLLAGYVLTRLSAPSTIKGWGLFWVALLGGVFISGFAEKESIASLPQVLISPGNVAFLLATAIFPLFTNRRRRHG